MTNVNKKILAWALLFIGFGCAMDAQEEGGRLFDDSFLHQIRIKSDSITDLWEAISREYVMVNAIIDGEQVDSIGLRVRGSTSAASPQKPLQLDLNEYIQRKKYDGLKKFNLRNNFKDPFLQREGLAYDLYRRAGLPSPRTSYAEVYIDDIFRGIYSITEMIDKTFLKHNFPSNNGSLYKGAFGLAGFSVELKEGTMAEFDQFKKNVKASNLEQFVHLDNYLKQLAVDIIIGDWDSYAYYRHNYYVYYETKSERLNFINWDHNYAFSAKPEAKDLYPVGTYPALNNLIENPRLKAMYEHTMCELLTYLVDSNYIADLVRHNYNIIRSNDNDVSVADPGPIVQYISARKQRLQDTLTSIGVNCNLSYPLNSNELVINEVVVSGDDLDKEEVLGSESSNWIELYNATSSDIVLGKHYYLSDDKDFPKKWNFPEEVTIPGNDYLIIWADGKSHLPGIHTGFQLEKSGGYLSMTYEDMTEIQNLSYGQHISNKGFARFPNEVGDFIIQSSTPHASNSTIINDENLSDSHAIVYLNPNNEFLSIESNQPVLEVAFSNMTNNETRRIKEPQFPLSIKGLHPGRYMVHFDLGGRLYNVEIEKY